MRRAYDGLRGRAPGDVRAALRAEAQAIMDEDIEISRSIGKYGLELLRPGMGILTHCNAGTLATAKYGTALRPEKAEQAVRDEIGIVFSHVLENAGVFKSDEAGQAAFLRFLKAAGFTPAKK